MYAEVTLPAGGNSFAFEVPKKAVVTTTERKYVVAADNGKAKYIDVSEGNQSADSTEVFGKLKAGDSIVVNATYEIEEGQSMQR
jgi:multidrug efflux pump subunit AcrA (membrane-fusion protein)